jgi:hypothetical protein
MKADREPESGLARIPGAKGWKHRESRCPGCDRIINATSDPRGRGAKPRKGDLTVALCCGTILRFDSLLRLGVITLAEIEALPASTRDELKDQQARWLTRQGRGKIVSLPRRLT